MSVTAGSPEAATEVTSMPPSEPAPESPRIADDPFAKHEEQASAPPTDLDDVEQDVVERAWNVDADWTYVVRGEQKTERFTREYKQKPLSYTSMLHFTGLLGQKIDEVMSGPEGLSLSDVVELAEIAQSMIGGKLVLSNENVGGIDSFVRGLAKIASYAPDLIIEGHCIWLRVPKHERFIVQEIWDRPVDEGGLSPDDGEEMLRIFIHQNYEELERFFVGRLGRIGRQIQKERKRIHPDD